MADDPGPSRAPRTSLPQLTDRLTLGASGLAVSPCCLGMSTEDTVVEAFAAGVNFFFITVDMHWPLYEGVRAGVRRLLRDGVPRDAIVVAATAYVTQRDFLWKPFDELLEAIPGLGRLDVVVAGGAYAGDYPVRRDVLRGHVAAGRFGARAVGTSFHERELVAAAVNGGELDVAYLRYNPGHLGARRVVFPALAPDRATPVYTFKSSTGADAVGRMVAARPELAGVWIPRVPDYYRFALADPAVGGVLCLLARPSEVTELADALAGPALDEDELDHMIALVASAAGDLVAS